ncbi:hypothetical protein Tdes44962_MAKER06514 [Teratosphaeria destructans]|uniref:Secreted protein n=1 Tax=Teratosphaeria destructans TaxID=418781 RepID=A0A9W7T1G3_9PEZI|nr:hypothetical protein Tdes44962_MAKER06514 [Teratosphaeria destructans]
MNQQAFPWILLVGAIVLLIGAIWAAIPGSDVSSPQQQISVTSTWASSSSTSDAWTTVTMPCYTREAAGDGPRGYQEGMCERVVRVQGE